MGKIQDFLKKQTVFWVLSGVVAVAGLASWVVASLSISSDTTKNGKEVNKHLDMTRGIVQLHRNNHPNQVWIKQKQDQMEQLKQRVYAAWEKIYQDQKQNVFVWPRQQPGQPEGTGLTEKFITAVKDLDPKKPGQELDPKYLDIYLRDAPNWFPRTAYRVAYGIHRDQTAPPGSRKLVTWGSGAADVKVNPEVSPLDVIKTNSLVKEVNPLSEWDTRPTTRQVLYAQEDLWVLEAVCDTIIRANATSLAAGRPDPAVRAIALLEIAAKAAKSNPRGTGERRVERFESVDPAAKERSRAKPESRRRTPDTGGKKKTSADDLLKNDRYVDAEGQPLKHNDAEPFAQYRLMPIYLIVMVDERELARVLAEFANSTLPLVVRAARYNSDKAAGDVETAAKNVSPNYQWLEIHLVARLMKPVDHGHLKIETPPAGGPEIAAKSPPDGDATTGGE